jgi:hypothetical protein
MKNWSAGALACVVKHSLGRLRSSTSKAKVRYLTTPCSGELAVA